MSIRATVHYVRQTWANFSGNDSTALDALLHSDTAWDADSTVTTRPKDDLSACIRAHNALRVIITAAAITQ